MQGYSRLAVRSSVTSWRSLVLFLTIAFTVASIAAFVTEPSLVDWYANLEKPNFTPPGWVFGIAWSFIYSSTAFAFWRVWLKRTKQDIFPAGQLYHLQLFLNLAWTVAFFGMHNPALAFASILLLQLANISTTLCFYKIDRLSAFLFLPYIWWVSFVSVLNFYIWIAN